MVWCNVLLLNAQKSWLLPNTVQNKTSDPVRQLGKHKNRQKIAVSARHYSSVMTRLSHQWSTGDGRRETSCNLQHQLHPPRWPRWCTQWPWLKITQNRTVCAYWHCIAWPSPVMSRPPFTQCIIHHSSNTQPMDHNNSWHYLLVLRHCNIASPCNMWSWLGLLFHKF